MCSLLTYTLDLNYFQRIYFFSPTIIKDKNTLRNLMESAGNHKIWYNLYDCYIK
nr:MAG TPA: hypothetical protein [Caudoviricetes sp.]